jgi:pimeloyl-ACP methyl ester carboxylesterase
MPRDQLVPANERVTFNVTVAGSGEPLVFLHPASGLAWNPFLDALAERFTVYAPAMPGTGGSTGIEAVRDLWDLVLCYYDLFDKLGLEAPHIVGHSLGGMIGAELAATDQSRVNRLVLICPAGLWLDEHPIPDIFAMLPQELFALLVADVESPVARQIAEAQAQAVQDPEAQIEAMVARTEALQAAAKFMWPIPDKGLRLRIHRIKAPTLLVWGAQDRLIPPVYGEQFRRLLPNARLVTLDGAGHLVPLEQLTRVVEEISGFLGQKAPAGVA